MMMVILDSVGDNKILLVDEGQLKTDVYLISVFHAIGTTASRQPKVFSTPAIVFMLGLPSSESEA